MTSLRSIKKVLSDKRVLAALAAAVLALGTGVYLFLQHSSTQQFAAEYQEYAALAQVQEDAANLPAAPNNPVRQELNLVLTEVLDSRRSPAQRLQDAQTGENLDKELDAEVDAIGDASDKANAVIAKMQVDSVSNFSSIGATGQILDLAKQRSSVIEDIRGLSYRADFDTEKIFETIVADNGQLTPAYIAQLNGDVPEIETEFDQRTALYTQLQSIGSQIDQKTTALGPSFAQPVGAQ